MTTSDDNQAVKRGRGRKPSGKPRDEILRDSQKISRAKKSEDGLVNFRAYVKPTTRDYMHALRSALDVRELGQVLDALAESQVLDVLVEKLKKHQ